MPWAKKKQDGKICVYKKTSGKILHCYPDSPQGENDANDYLAALHMHASDKELKTALVISKKDDGRYHIVAVSTAALEDREGETFDAEAMDYDIRTAKQTGEYPEFRLFHQQGLGFGKVTDMRRVGIFAVDEGYSYTDAFSTAVCEKMLVPNPGKWKASRGFFILEASGGCPSCGANLLIGTKQLKSGFRCPECNAAYKDYKGVLESVHFRKTKTFDITVTDRPAVPWTGVAAFSNVSEDFMNKKELKQKLLDAGLTEETVDERLGTLSDTQLKEYTAMPFAQVLKEFDAAEDEAETDSDALDLDEVVKEFTAVVEQAVENKVKQVLDAYELKVTDLGELEVDMKEVQEIVVLKEAVDSLQADITELKQLVGKLVEKDERRLKELLDDMPRAGKLRIRRYKAADPDEEDEDTEEGDEDEMPVRGMHKRKELGVAIVGADGETASSMTEWLTRAGSK